MQSIISLLDHSWYLKDMKSANDWFDKTFAYPISSPINVMIMWSTSISIKKPMIAKLSLMNWVNFDLSLPIFILIHFLKQLYFPAGRDVGYLKVSMLHHMTWAKIHNFNYASQVLGICIKYIYYHIWKLIWNPFGLSKNMIHWLYVQSLSLQHKTLNKLMWV